MQWTHSIPNGQKQFNKCVLLQIERFSRHKNYDFMITPCAPSVLYIPVDYMQFTKRPKSFRSQILIFVKFIFSEKATNFCEISTVDLSYVVTVKSTVEISQNFVAFSDYVNFTKNMRYINKDSFKEGSQITKSQYQQRFVIQLFWYEKGLI